MSCFVFKTDPLVSILFTFSTSLSYRVFLTILLLIITLLSLLKSIETVFNFSTSILSISAFKVAKFDFSANLEVPIPVAFFKSAFVTKLDKSTLTLMSPKGPYFRKINHFIQCLFYAALK